MHVNTKSEQTFEPTSVTIHLDAETNRLLTEASKITGRSKKTEAEFRVVDHIKRFEHYLTPQLLKEREPGRGKSHYIRRK